MNTKPYWFAERVAGGFPPLGGPLQVDVLVIGGGITGVTAAYLMARDGVSVALVEREKIGGSETGHTTAHLTYMTDTRLSDLISTFSRGTARLAWEAGRDAMEFIARTVEAEGVDCRLRVVPGYLAAAAGGDLKEEIPLLQEEAKVVKQMGFECEFIDSVPVTSRPGILFSNQMKFHPLLYLDALAKKAVEAGARIFEKSEVSEFAKEPGRVVVEGHQVEFKHVFIATHVPLQGDSSTLGAASFQTKLALYSTYAIGARIARGSLAEMIWSDTADPFLYLRVEPGAQADYCIFGGEDHKTGQDDQTTDRYRKLEEQLGRWVSGAEIMHHWSGQVVETIDGLPYIGPTSENQFIATGFSGNGMTFGTASALMFRDHVAGSPNRYEEVFDPGRKTASAFAEYFKQNKDFPIRMIADRMHVEERDPASLACGEGCVLEHGGQRIAAYRGEDGTLSTCSAVCPHLGCIVAWNEAESTWDCPCHGSRFTAKGAVIAGPAESDLKKI